MLSLNSTVLTQPQGLCNIGANCYFNALMQCLFSCTSVYETLDEIKDEPFVKQNRLADTLVSVWKSHINGTATSNNVLPIYRDMLEVARKQQSIVRMDSGQQDSHEGLMMIFTALESIPHIQRLFNNRYLCTVVCTQCKQTVVSHKDVSSFVDIPEDFDGQTLQSYLLSRKTTLDDYQCVCGYKGPQEMVINLTRAPNVIPILLKKYTRKTNIQLPQTMSFPGLNGTRLNYQLVACCEHSGSMGGGHYWATALRSSGEYNLNDNSYGSGTVATTESTYIAFYHYV